MGLDNKQGKRENNTVQIGKFTRGGIEIVTKVEEPKGKKLYYKRKGLKSFKSSQCKRGKHAECTKSNCSCKCGHNAY